MWSPTKTPLDFGPSQSWIFGSVASSDYLVTAGDVVTLTFTDTSTAGVNTFQWVDENGDTIPGQTALTTNWTSTTTEQPPRIRVTNSLGQVRVFSVTPAILFELLLGIYLGPDPIYLGSDILVLG